MRGFVFGEDGGDSVRETDEGRDVQSRGGHARIPQEHEVPLVQERHEINDE